MKTYLSNLGGAVALNYSFDSKVNLKVEAGNVIIQTSENQAMKRYFLDDF